MTQTTTTVRDGGRDQDFLAPAKSLPAKAGCMRTSPPDSVIPPLDARNTPR